MSALVPNLKELHCANNSAMICPKKYEYFSEYNDTAHSIRQQSFRSCHFKSTGNDNVKLESEVIITRMIKGWNVIILTYIVLVFEGNSIRCGVRKSDAPWELRRNVRVIKSLKGYHDTL